MYIYMLYIIISVGTRKGYFILRFYDRFNR